MIRINIILFSILFFNGCRQSEFKKVVAVYANGKNKIIYYYPDINDTLSFRKEVLYPSGMKNYVGNILNNQKIGVWTWWYENGHRKDQCKYLNGFCVDSIFHWNKDGQLIEIEIVKPQSVRDTEAYNCNGTFLRFFANGKPKEQFTWINNIQSDTAKGWYENGQLEIISSWMDGVQNGLCKEFYSNGQIKTEANFVNGWEEGKVTRWDSLGKVISIEYWKDKNLVSSQ
jgi:antitoxin component YwqK of YwqJK toxin-antitoxin module